MTELRGAPGGVSNAENRRLIPNHEAPPQKRIPAIAGLAPKEDLLVWQQKQKLEDALKNHSTVILAAGTGTGKTRGGSQIALDVLGPTGNMIVTENLRQATEESAKVIASDMGVEVGGRVGVHNRYTHKVSAETKLLFCPVQSLLIKIESDPLLRDYNLIAMDEVHKESKSNELCMIALREIQAIRKARNLPELKLMFISATADKAKIMKHFPDAVPVEVPGKTFPVAEVFETQPIPVPELPKKAAEKVQTAIQAGEQGNILVFLSGKAQIDQAGDALASMNLKDVEVIRYYGAASKEERDRMFAEGSKRKIVLATNAAQESLTLDVNIIVDTCMHKHMQLDTITGRQYLIEKPAPGDHLTQRRGRVGRKESPHPYKYYALTTKPDWDSRQSHEAAEMQRTDLTQEMLILLGQGHKDVYNFKYINTPPRTHIDIALKRLEKIGAYKNGVLTPKGEFMAGLQLKPNVSSMVVSGITNGCARQTSILASMLEAYSDALEVSSNLKNPNSDILSLLQIYNAFASQEASQQRQWAQKNGFDYIKLHDAKKLYEELIRDVKEKIPGINLDINPPPLSLDKSIYEACADGLLIRGWDGTYHMEGVQDGIKIARESALQGKDVKNMTTFDVRSLVKSDKITDRIASLNHPIPDALMEELKQKNKPPIEAKPTLPAQTDAKPEVKNKPEEAAAPPTPPPPPPQTMMQRFKSWVSNSWFGKLWKWIIK